MTHQAEFNLIITIQDGSCEKVMFSLLSVCLRWLGMHGLMSLPCACLVPCPFHEYAWFHVPSGEWSHVPSGGRYAEEVGPEGVDMCRDGRIGQRVGMSRGGYVQGWVFSGVGMYTHLPAPPLALTPTASCQNIYGWQVGCTHPTGMLSCSK